MTDLELPLSVVPQQEKLSLDKLADKVFIDILSRIPGVKMRFATPEEDSGVVSIDRSLAVDVVGYKDGKHAFTAQITTASTQDKIDKMKRQMLAMPFVQTSKLSDHLENDPPLVPRFNIRIDNGTMRKFELNPDIDAHPDIKKTIREQLQFNIRYLLTKLSSDLQGVPLKGPMLKKAQGTDQYKQIQALQEMFSGGFI